MKSITCSLFLLLLLFFNFGMGESFAQQKKVPSTVRSNIGDSIVTRDGGLKIKIIGQKHGFGQGATFDADIHSPKSASFLPNGEKFYVNSLEGCKTVVYQTEGLKKLKTINHNFNSGEGSSWLKPSGYYKFTHYPNGEKRQFQGKPVEEALSKDARYMFVPYYRRTFDINAQDPSALAVIDTKTDSIVLMTETGPLPKMVTVSNDGKLLAITHWGDNTVGFMDISNPDPKKWFHLPPVIVDHQLKLNYSLTKSIDRDSGSGYALRGTVFLPGDSIMLVAGMGGPTAIIDVKNMKYLGMINSLTQMRHIVINGDKIFFSRNASGEVYSVPIDSILSSVRRNKGLSKDFKVGGIKKVSVGGGARTLKLSPDGKYIYVACNSASALYVVDSESMEVIGRIPVDSYPVGLDVSPNGKYIVVTSQGRSGRGGNAVNIFEVEYLKPVENAAIVPVMPEENADINDEPLVEYVNEPQDAEEPAFPLTETILVSVAVLAGIIGVVFVARRRRLQH